MTKLMKSYREARSHHSAFNYRRSGIPNRSRCALKCSKDSLSQSLDRVLRNTSVKQKFTLQLTRNLFSHISISFCGRAESLLNLPRPVGHEASRDKNSEAAATSNEEIKMEMKLRSRKAESRRDGRARSEQTSEQRVTWDSIKSLAQEKRSEWQCEAENGKRS